VVLDPNDDYHTFVRDVIKYFGLGHREPVNAKLADILDAAPSGAPVLLVSHSLGTVVAYDVLTAGNYRIDTWVTLGSPLGWVQGLQAQLPGWLTELSPEKLVPVTEVLARGEEAVATVLNKASAAKDHIADFFGRFRRRGRREVYTLPQPIFPLAKVDRWFNIYDPGDPVATAAGLGHRTLTDVYLDGGRERVYDIQVHNTPGNPHSEVGYLQTLQTVWLVKDFLARHG
jgi:hypothetical protein